MDKVSKEVRSKIMRAVHSNDTRMEEKFRKELFSRGVRFRKNVSDLPGKPDIAIKSKRVVIFLDSCFWHGCPEHLRQPKSNKNYWDKKVKLNVERDHKINSEYRIRGWKLVRIWEHEIKDNPEKCINRIIEVLATN